MSTGKTLEIVKHMKEVKQSVKANKGKIGADYGELSPEIIKKVEKLDADALIESFVEKGKYEITVKGKKIGVFKDHVEIEREVPEHLADSESRYGVVYLDLTRDEELVKEGYARELMRHVQAQRKKAGLEKKDRISLFVKADAELVKMLKGWEKQIKEKVGADKLAVSPEGPKEKYSFTFDGDIKGKEFVLLFSKV